jgi:hypothetical protein
MTDDGGPMGSKTLSLTDRHGVRQGQMKALAHGAEAHTSSFGLGRRFCLITARTIATLSNVQRTLSLDFKRKGLRLVSMSTLYVDDLLRTAPPEFRPGMENELRSRFDCKTSKTLPTSFSASSC